MYQFQCKIIELPSGDKKWNKGIAQIQQIFIDKEKAYTSQEKLLFYTDKETSHQLGQGDIILVKSKIQKMNKKYTPLTIFPKKMLGMPEYYNRIFERQN